MVKIAILMAGGYALSPSTDGRKSQILYQAAALERIGHEVARLNPWESYSLEQFDAVHIVEGGLGNIPGVFGRIQGVKKMGMATFIDTSTSNMLYRSLTRMGRLHPRLITQQGLFYRQAQVCDVVIARSRDEERLLVRGIGVPQEKVRIVLNGVNPPGPVDVEGVRRELGIAGDFALHISMFTQARKNVVRLIEAVGPLNIPLVIAGTAGPAEELKPVEAAARAFPAVKLLGRLTQRQRDSLYAACRVFCLPSIYEGTGLVALEAASHGAAVVITRHGGPPDYFADLAEYVEPLDVANIREAIRRAWERPRDGRLQAHVVEKLSWDHSARSLAAAYGG